MHYKLLHFIAVNGPKFPFKNVVIGKSLSFKTEDRCSSTMTLVARQQWSNHVFVHMTRLRHIIITNFIRSFIQFCITKVCKSYISPFLNTLICIWKINNTNMN